MRLAPTPRRTDERRALTETLFTLRSGGVVAITCQMPKAKIIKAGGGRTFGCGAGPGRYCHRAAALPRPGRHLMFSAFRAWRLRVSRRPPPPRRGLPEEARTMPVRCPEDPPGMGTAESGRQDAAKTLWYLAYDHDPPTLMQVHATRTRVLTKLAHARRRRPRGRCSRSLSPAPRCLGVPSSLDPTRTCLLHRDMFLPVAPGLTC